MTDPTGPIFLSYKRERAAEAGLLVDALRDHGVLSSPHRVVRVDS